MRSLCWPATLFPQKLDNSRTITLVGLTKHVKARPEKCGSLKRIQLQTLKRGGYDWGKGIVRESIMRTCKSSVILSAAVLMTGAFAPVADAQGKFKKDP